jgi:hypothetical protein
VKLDESGVDFLKEVKIVPEWAYGACRLKLIHQLWVTDQNSYATLPALH